MAFELIDLPWTTTGGWIAAAVVFVGAVIMDISVYREEGGKPYIPTFGIVGVILAFCAAWAWGGISYHNNPHVEAWGEPTHVLESDLELTMATIVESSGDGMVSHGSDVESFIVRDGDDIYENCELRFGTPDGGTVDGWVECTSIEEESNVAVFGKL